MATKTTTAETTRESADEARANARMDQRNADLAATRTDAPSAGGAALLKIARNAGIETLETRGNDSLDFHDLAVWQVREMLEAAYHAGRAAR